MRIHEIIFALVAVGTSASSATTVSVTFKSSDYGEQFTVIRGMLYNVSWPIDHPFEVSQIDLGPALNASFEYTRDATITSFRVPTSYTGTLFYYCAEHKEQMKHIQITLEDAPVITVKATTPTGVRQLTPAPAPASPAAGTTCPGVQSLPDKAEAALKVTRISLADDAAKDTSTETFKQFAAHYLKIVAPPAKCKVLYDSVLARMKTDDVVHTSHARSLLTHSMLVAAVCAAALTAIAVGSNVFR